MVRGSLKLHYHARLEVEFIHSNFPIKHSAFAFFLGTSVPATGQF